MQLHQILREIDRLDQRFDALKEQHQEFVAAKKLLLHNIELSRVLQRRCEDAEKRILQLEGETEPKPETVHSSGYNTNLESATTPEDILTKVFTRMSHNSRFFVDAMLKLQSISHLPRAVHEKMTTLATMNEELTQEIHKYLKGLDVENSNKRQSSPTLTSTESEVPTKIAFANSPSCTKDLAFAKDDLTSASSVRTSAEYRELSTAIEAESPPSTAKSVQYEQLSTAARSDVTQYDQLSTATATQLDVNQYPSL